MTKLLTVPLRDDHKMQWLDHVWDERRRKRDNKQPNGYIVNILWADKEAIVKFYSDNYGSEAELVSYSFYELRPYWTDMFGGEYHIEDYGQ